MYSKDELKNLKLEFWESFAAFCEVQPYLRGRKKTWVLYDCLLYTSPSPRD